VYTSQVIDAGKMRKKSNSENEKIISLSITLGMIKTQVTENPNHGRCHLSGIPLQKGFFPLSQRDFYFINCC
jgi:hypothetical protein